MTSLVLADDHHVVRQGLRLLLEEEPDFHIVGEAANGLEAVQLVANLSPDILVLDLMMIGLNGIDVARQVRKNNPNTAIVVLSMYNNEAYVLEALKAGVMAYILKESTSTELVRGIREALAGRHYLSPPLSDLVIKVYIEKSSDNYIDPYDKLTAREREVLSLTANGHTTANIAEQLCLSQRTVEFYRYRVMRKLVLHNRSELIRYATERGLLPSRPLLK